MILTQAVLFFQDSYQLLPKTQSIFLPLVRGLPAIKAGEGGKQEVQDEVYH